MACRVKRGAPLSQRNAYSRWVFCVIWSIKGDLDWYAKGLGLKSYNANDPCEFCPCSKDGGKPLWPMNFGPTCAWKHRLHTGRAWRAAKTGMHLLFKSFVFLSCLNLEADELHTLYLGVSQYFLGSVLWLLVYVTMVGDPADNMQQVWQLILQQYSEPATSTQFSALQLSSFTIPAKHNTVYPKLKGKGAEVKALVLPLLCVWKMLRRRGSAHDNRVVACFDAPFGNPRPHRRTCARRIHGQGLFCCAAQRCT